MNISIVIPNWNGMRCLPQCLQSITENPASYSTEIIVVDNASTDGSLEWLESFSPRVRIIRNLRNLGFACAANQGIEASRGNLIYLLNSDVYQTPGCLDALARFMDCHPQAALCAPAILGMDGHPQTSCRKFPRLSFMISQILGIHRLVPYLNPDLPTPAEPLEVDWLCGCYWVMRRSALDVIGPLDESFFFYGEDIDWCHRCHDHHFPVYIEPGAVAIHQGGASSQGMPPAYELKMMRARRHYFHKHHGSCVSRTCFLLQLLLTMRRIGQTLLPAPCRGGRRLIHEWTILLRLLNIGKTI